jgi:hypothetical protein
MRKPFDFLAGRGDGNPARTRIPRIMLIGRFTIESQRHRNVNDMPLQHSRGDWTPLELFLAGTRALALESRIVRILPEVARSPEIVVTI